MEGLDNFQGSADDSKEESSGASVSYLEISEEKHPEAYEAIAQGGPIRGAFSSQKGPGVNDLFADLIEALEPVFSSGDRRGILAWALPTEDSEEAAELLNDYVEARDDLEGEVQVVDE